MIIGLYDADLVSAPNKPKVNLEIMKMATFFTKHNHIVELVLDLEEIDRYDKIYVRKEKEKTPIPSSLLLNPKVEWGGLGFTNNIHVPCSPIEIEYCQPTTSIYNKFFKRALKNGTITEKRYKEIMNRNYFRLYLDGKLMDDSWLEYNKPISLFDTQLNSSPGWLEQLQILGGKTKHKVELFYPLVFTEITDDFHKFLCLPKIKRTSTKIVLDVPFTSVGYKQFISKYAFDLNHFSDQGVFLTCGKNYYGDVSTSFFKHDFLETCNKIGYACSKGVILHPLVYKAGIVNEYERHYNAIDG